MKLTIGKKIKYSVTGIVIFLALFIFIYFPMKQKDVMIESYGQKVQSLAETVSLGVTIGLKNGDISATQRAFDYAKKETEVRFIVLSSGSDVIASYPEGFKMSDSILKADTVIVKSTEVKTDAFEGKISIGASKGKIDAEVSSMKFTTLILAVGFIFFGLVVAYVISKNISNPIHQLEEAANKISSGDLDSDVNVKSNDEIGSLAQSFKLMLKNIKDANEQLKKEKENIGRKVDEAVKESEEQKLYLTMSVNKILTKIEMFADGDLTVELEVEKDDDIGKLYKGFNRSVQNIKNMLVQITEAVQATASASSQISSSSEEMAAGSQEQSSQVTEIASAVEEMTKTIIETTKNTGIVAENSKLASENAKKGAHKIDETKKGMERIVTSAQQTGKIISSLALKSDQIGEITQVIDDIADQTNLLALNAAIEAARAGEQGRGFAVVADEVRKLAERTTKATKEIAETISTIQKEAKEADTSMAEAGESVKVGMKLTEEVSYVLDEILGVNQKVSDMVNQVAAASEEQSATAEQISKNIESISNVTQESAAGTQQIAKAAEDLNQLTNKLQNLIDQFKLDNKSGFTIQSHRRFVKS